MFVSACVCGRICVFLSSVGAKSESDVPLAKNEFWKPTGAASADLRELRRNQTCK